MSEDRKPQSERRVALYARVSSDKQAQERSIDSQVSLLRGRIEADGETLDPELCFQDNGVSGATLVRPGLERLRDQAAAGAVDRLYVLAPDRLARRFAHQMVLADELQACGVEVVYVNRPLGATPEDQLLLQVQGVVAEYERAKILERTRRGRLHAARCGRVSVLTGAPFGYRYIDKHSGGGTARYEIVDDEARIVRQIFTWVGRDGCSLAEVARRLEQQGVRTRTGRPRWTAATLWCMLTHTTYRGQARFGRTRVGERRPTLRPRRGQPEVPKRMSTRYAQPATEHLVIAVPALVDAELFAAAQEQLAAHRLHLRRRQGTRFLLQGLAVCAECGYGMYAKSSCGGPSHEYAYYRCRGSDGSRFGGQRVCDNPMQRRELMDETVWQDVCGLLREPGRLQQEYERRCHPSPEARASAASEVERLRTAVVKVKQGMNRLIDAYSEGLVERTDFEPRIRQLKNRLAKLEADQHALQEQARQEQERSLIFSRWDEFVEQIQQSLTTADWPKRREIVRTLVKRVEVAKNHLRIVYKVPDRPFANHPSKGVVPYCLGVHERT